MIGKILFLSGAAFVAYKYIGDRNRKAKELRQVRDLQQILPPEPATHEIDSSARLLPSSSATELLRDKRPATVSSSAAEDLPSR
jgi:hypothetical protein